MSLNSPTPPERDGLLDELGLGGSIAGIVGAILFFVNLYLGQNGLRLATDTLYVAAIWWWAIRYYRRTEETQPGSTPSRRRWVHDVRIRFAIGVTLFVGIVATWTVANIAMQSFSQQHERPARVAQRLATCPAKKFCVLVAPLEGSNGGVTQSLYEDLYGATAPYPEIVIRKIDQPITAAQNSVVARSIATKWHANVMLWGWYEPNPGGVLGRIHFEVITQPREVVSSAYSASLTTRVADISSFEQKVTVSAGNMSYLTLLIAGLHSYEAMDYGTAIKYFGSALARPGVAQRGVDPAYVYLYRGNAFMHAHTRSNVQQAVADFKRSIALKPTVEAYMNMAWSNGFPLHHTQLGIDNYSSALNLNRHHDIYAEAEAYDFQGVLHFFRHENLAARADIDRSIRLNPYAAAPYPNRADVELALGRGNNSALTRSFAYASISSLIIESCTTKILYHQDYYEPLYDEGCLEGRHPSGRLKLSTDGRVIYYHPPTVTPTYIKVVPTIGPNL